MDTYGNCTVCKGKCNWERHTNNSFYFEATTESKFTTLADLKKI